MAGFRENRISIVDLFSSISAWANANAKQTAVDHSGKLSVYKGRGSKTNTYRLTVAKSLWKSNPKRLVFRSMPLKGEYSLNKAH